MKTDTITQEDLANKLKEVLGNKSPKDLGKKEAGAFAAFGVFMIFVLAIYFLGRRRGRKSRTIVEIKKI